MDEHVLHDPLFSHSLSLDTDSFCSSTASPTTSLSENGPPSPFSDGSFQHESGALVPDMLALPIQHEFDQIFLDQINAGTPTLTLPAPIQPLFPSTNFEMGSRESAAASEAPKRTSLPRSKSKADSSDSNDTDDACGKPNSNCKRQRNKVSASKYRMKKKQYLDDLENEAKLLKMELGEKSQRIETLETENKLLKDQIAFLKKLIAPSIQKTGVVMFVLFSCFLLFSPMLMQTIHSSQTTSNESPAGRQSRVLLWYDDIVSPHSEADASNLRDGSGNWTPLHTASNNNNNNESQAPVMLSPKSVLKAAVAHHAVFAVNMQGIIVQVDSATKL